MICASIVPDTIRYPAFDFVHVFFEWDKEVMEWNGGTARGCAGILSAPPPRSSVRQMCDMRGVWFVRRARIPAPANLARRAACTLYSTVGRLLEFEHVL